MKQFIHEKIDLGYDDLDADTTDSGRFYKAPDGSRYPSVTTVLSLLSRDAIRAWRERVGEEEANKVSYRASTRGTKVHEIVEQYLDNEHDPKKWTPDILASLENLKPYLHRIDKIYEQDMTVRQAESLVKSMMEKNFNENDAGLNGKKTLSSISKSLGAKVKLEQKKSSRKGKIVIEFNSAQEFRRICEKLLNAEKKES